ncbi:hypothetical protein MYSTI_02619 [Myxococcus stipitatus DSM 14675]|uniref:Peptidase S1 domain-containing protein n=1 Tax=Myxococcus stipitatus (strain DSM 14675 / JCM 12634 / Mx s8) TaxID=1278073 RepID=L7U833_MYXSD|nr:hypothetical protein [Myxococcus stipitatus]AGC43935.1 hypothetical protein MYSTI_02619 [Myxococcus stipitatus DSM 14675]
METTLRAAWFGASFHLSILGAALAACRPLDEPTTEEPGATPQQVQLAYRDYYDMAFSPGGAMASSQLSRGTLFVPMRQPDTHELRLGLDGSPLRYTCGVTFISPRKAITAAHCVDDINVWDPPHQPLEVQMYDPMVEADVKWEATANSLAGTFPRYRRTPLGPGYSTTSYQCRVVSRCGNAYGTYNCPGNFPRADTALLDCGPASPGCRYDYLSVADHEGVGVPVSMAWAHEVYAIPDDRRSDLWQHYTLYANYDPVQNYHYYPANQLLPLVSKPWSDPPRPTVSLGVTLVGTDARLTELHGCHGSSGSGITQLNAGLGTQELLGPVATWDKWVFTAHDYDFLCEDPDRTARKPGDGGLGYARLAVTQKLAEGRSTTDVCGTEEPGLFPNPLLWLTHDIWILRKGMVGRQAFPKRWPCTDTTCTAWERLRIVNEPLVPVARGETVTLPPANVVAGMTYRVSVRIRSLEGTPPLITLALGNQTLLRGVRPVVHAAEAAGLVGIAFKATRGGSQTLQISAAQGSGAFAVTEITTVADPLANGFEYRSQRVGMGIVEPGTRTPVPATWTRMGSSGFAARVKGGQRFLVTRQAFIRGRTWRVEFDTSRDVTGATCGFITSDNRELRMRCNSVSRHILAHFNLGDAQPVAFFVDLPKGQPDLALDNLRLETR